MSSESENFIWRQTAKDTNAPPKKRRPAEIALPATRTPFRSLSSSLTIAPKPAQTPQSTSQSASSSSSAPSVAIAFPSSSSALTSVQRKKRPPQDRTKARENTAARKKVADAQKEVVTSAVWKTRIEKVQERADEFRIAARASSSLEPLAHLEKLVNYVSASQDRVLFDMAGPFAVHLRSAKSSLLSMLLNMADSGTAFEVDDWKEVLERVEKESQGKGSTDNGILEEEEGEEEESEEELDERENLLGSDKEGETSTALHMPSVYLRKVTGTVEEMLHWSKPFVKSFPTREPEELAFQKSIEKKPMNEMVSRFYCGIASRKKGWERDRDDLKSKISTRYTDFVKSNHLEDRVEHFQFKIKGKEWLVVNGRAGFRESLIIQEMEEVLIAVCGVAGLNSAFGRLRSSFSPNSEDRAIRDAVNLMLKEPSSSIPLSPLNPPQHSARTPPSTSSQQISTLPLQTLLLSHSDRQALREAKINLLRKHALDLNQTLKLKDQGVSDKYLKTWLFNATTFEVSARGSLDTPVHSLGDITVEELDQSNGVDFHNTRNGNSPFSDKRVQALIRNIATPFTIPSTFSAPSLGDALTSTSGRVASYPSPVSPASKIIAQQYGCVLDLFGMSTDHEDVANALYFWLRHLRILGAQIVSSSSSQVSRF